MTAQKKQKRFQVYYSKGSVVQLRDNRKTNDGFANAGIVAVFPTLGAGFSTSQTPDQSLRFARKIAKLLNAPNRARRLK